MDETWGMSPLNPNSQNNQTTYVYGTEAAEVEGGQPQREMGPIEGSIVVLVLIAVVFIIFAPMFNKDREFK